MSIPVTVPGVQQGGTYSTIVLQFATQQNASLATQLLNQIYTSAFAGTLNVQNAPISSPTGSAVLNEYVLGDNGGVQNTGTNDGAVPAGYLGIVDAFTNQAATITGAANQGESVLSGQGGLTFVAAANGSGTFIAGGGNNVFATPSSAGGNWDVIFDGGNNLVYGLSGNLSITDGTSPSITGGGAGRNLIFLSGGTDSLVSWGTDTIVAGSGGSAAIATFGSGSVVFGGSEPTLAVNFGDNNTFVQGTGPETIFAGGTGGIYYGNTGNLLFVNGAGSNIVATGAGNATLFGGTGNSLYFVGQGSFLLDGGSGAQTVVGSAGLSSGATVFSENNGSVMLLGNSNNNVLVAGTGNVTLNGAAATGSNVFFAGSGADSLAGGSGVNILLAGTGSDTLSGGANTNLFGFFAGLAGGSDFIVNWNVNDSLYLTGYGAAGANGLPAGATTSTTTVNGASSEVLTLGDGTKITFVGVTNVNTGQIHSS
jgi:Ca2+-binding RTX toxin-like protein